MGWIRHVSQKAAFHLTVLLQLLSQEPLLFFSLSDFIPSPSHFFYSVPSFGLFWGCSYCTLWGTVTEDFVLLPCLWMLGEDINFYVFSLHLCMIIS